MTTSLKTKALKGFSWMFAGTVGQNLLQFLSLVILSRLITPEEFGVVAMALLIIGFLTIFSELGVGPAVVQRLELTVSHIKTANTLSLSLGVLLCTTLYFTSNSLALFFDMPSLELVIKTLAIMLPFSALTVVGQSLLQRKTKFKQIALYNFLSYLLGYVFIAIPMAYLGYGIWALVFAQLGNIFVMMILIRVSVKETIYYGFHFDSAKELLNYGIGQSISSIANYTASQGDTLVAGKMLDAASVGLYSRAFQIMMLPVNTFGSVMDKVLFPIMSSIQNDKERLAKAYLEINKVVAIIVFPASACLFIFSEEIVLILLGPNWTESIPLLQIFSLIMFFRLSYKLSHTLVRSVGAVYKRAIRDVFYAINVFVFVLVGSFWGLKGVAISMSLAIFINFVILGSLSLSLIEKKWTDFLKGFVPFLIFSMVLAAIIYPLKEIYFIELHLIFRLGIGSFVFLSVYALFIYFLWKFNKLNFELIGKRT